MPEKPDTKNAPSAPDLVEVRLVVPTPRGALLIDGVERRCGDVFKIDRRIYLASVEPDRGVGRPARSRTFALVADERAAEEQKKAEASAVQDRIAAMRKSVADQEAMRELGAASARAIAAEATAEAKKQLEAMTKPMERPGAHRVS